MDLNYVMKTGFNLLFPFSDLAIGAPYEDEQRGAVYIYNGYTLGLWPKYSQKITGKDVDPGLRGFGITFSNTADANSDGIMGKWHSVITLLTSAS